MTALSTVQQAEPNRDRWGRPLITPPGGGKAKAYTRVTTLAKTLEEQSALTAWKQRMTLIGASLAPHLVLAAAAHREDKKRLNELAEQAMTAAQAGAKAIVGTALHAITETIDLGGDPGPYPEQYRRDVEAYVALRERERLGAVMVEQFIVLDDIEVAGTADLVDRVQGPLIAPDGTDLDGDLLINDKKTGSIEYAGMAIAIQLACYARGSAYDVGTGARTPLGTNTRWGLVTHLPAGQGIAELHWVDLEAGWDAAQQSMKARALRKRKAWLTPAGMPVRFSQATIPVQSTGPDLPALIAAAPDRDALLALWAAHESTWNESLTELVKARLAGLAH